MNKRNFLITAALSAAFCFFGTANAAETLKIGASPVPHADILKVVQPELAKKGIDLKIIEFSDYVQPNLALGCQLLPASSLFRRFLERSSLESGVCRSSPYRADGRLL